VGRGLDVKRVVSEGGEGGKWKATSISEVGNVCERGLS
jgi:hypothetical protein